MQGQFDQLEGYEPEHHFRGVTKMDIPASGADVKALLKLMPASSAN